MADWLVDAGGNGLATLDGFWKGLLEFLPALIFALIVFIIGWLLAAFIGKIFEGILKKLQLDKLFKTKKWNEALESADFLDGPSEFIGGLIKWILITVVLSISIEILGLTTFSSFLNTTVIATWIPNILAAILIFVATVIIAGFVEKMVKASLHGAKIEHSKLGGTIARWLIWIFGIAAIFDAFQIDTLSTTIATIFTGIIAFIVITGGLAFGLGGREEAASILKDLRKKLK
jgi:hypothetical protein